MYSVTTVCSILERNGLDACAQLMRERMGEVNAKRFVEMLCNPRYLIHLPLACILWDVDMPHDDMSATEMDHLVLAIDEFQLAKQLTESEVGLVLDHILRCHKQKKIIATVPDLIGIFSLLHAPSSTWILDLLAQPGANFWNALYNKWVLNHGVPWISSLVVSLLRAVDPRGLNEMLSRTDHEQIREFFEDLEQVQACEHFLLASDWQRILERRVGIHGHAIATVHAAVLGRCFLNWLHSALDPAAFDTQLPEEIVSVLMSLVQDKRWRFADVSKLFRFSKRAEDLPGLLAALIQIQEGNLTSTALDRLPNAVSISEVSGMMENDREFPPATETSRAEAIQLIANSDFSQFNHSDAPVTASELTRMMSKFDEAYSGSGGDFGNVAKAVKAVEQFYKVKLRDVQILGVLLAVQARRSNVSRLLQMQTGEGKTFVIAVLAIAEVLSGNSVDIITSSEMLAITQTSELTELYASVGVTVRHNCDDDRKKKENSKLYEANVVYGTAASFMFDVLYEDFWGSKLRSERGFPLAIVDEVDAQMLDHANHVCRFASSASGMGNLLGMQAAVWMLVSQHFHDMNFADGAWNVKTDEGTMPIDNVSTLKEYFKDGLTDTVQKTAGFQDGFKEENKVLFPKTLHEFCKRELPMWLTSAVEAILKKQDYEYCIEDGQIVIVDSARSGTRNRGVRWSFGLHQFLEMRHATKLSPENLTMCFISTMSFCRRYGSNLVGLTGTIGGAASRKFLHQVYNVDFVEIPPFMAWRHIILPHVFCDNTNHWLSTVIEKVVTKLSEGRACLVITQYIHFAELLSREIGKRSSGRVGTYTGGGGDIDVSGKIGPGTCVVATNVAGRGTDFKITDAVERAGGLHVMLTSLPENDRVERQNIGRSSRTGQRGTSQMVLNVDQVDAYFLDEMARRAGEGASHNVFVNTLREVRDDWVMRCVDGWIGQMETTHQSDTAQSEFIKMRNDLIERYKDLHTPAKNEDKSYIQMMIESALNIRFGIYLATSHSALEPEKLRNDFVDLPAISDREDIPKCFSDYVYPIYAAWALDWNPEENPDDFELAQKLLDRAIQLDPMFAGAAYYIRAYSFLISFTYSDNPSYIREAIEDLKQSREVLQRLLDQYQLLIVATKRKDEDKTKLGAQIERIMAICGFITSNIDIMIGRNVREELNKLQAMLEDMKQRGQDTSELEKNEAELKEHRVTFEKGILKEILDEGTELTLKEHRLKDMLPENMNKDEFAEEILHFENEGYFRMFSVKKRNKINWWNVVGVAMLGLLQIVGGALLAVFTGGVAAAFGVGLMVGGCFDIFVALKSGIIDRDFDWASYGMEKLFDLVTSVITAGISGMKNAAKGISMGIKTIGKIGSSQLAKEAVKHAGKQAGKAAVLVGAKITASEVFNATAAGPMKKAVTDLLTDETRKLLSGHLAANPHLLYIVNIDNHHNNRTYSMEFVGRATDRFLSKFSSEFLERLAKSIGDGLRGNQAVGKSAKAAISATNVAIVIAKIGENLGELPGIVESVAVHADSGGNQRHEERVYERKGQLSVDSVLQTLAYNIADFCATKAVSKTQNFFSSKVSKMIVDTGFKRSDQQLQHFKNAFVHSQDVASRARSIVPKNAEQGAVLEGIAQIAENNNTPGDRMQAQYLAEAVQTPIEIEYKDAKGNRRLIVYGKEFSKNAPIRLQFQHGDNGRIGHYSFFDGTHAKQSGRNTCLFDTVSQITKYESSELKRAAANFMFNDLGRVTNAYMRSNAVDLLIGGVRKRGPPRSSSAIKHVEATTTVNDVLNKANTTQRARKRGVPRNTVVDHDFEDFDSKADANFDQWISNHPPTRRNAAMQMQYDYIHDESNIYEVVYSPKKRNPIQVNAFRGDPAFKVEHLNGAVHYDAPLTQQNTAPQTIWQQGDPSNVQLHDLFRDHPDYNDPTVHIRNLFK